MSVHIQFVEGRMWLETRFFVNILFQSVHALWHFT